MKYTVRPISDRSPFTGKHQPSPFRALWSNTLELLETELEAVNATDVVIEADVTEADIRLDGMLRANARAATPAVRLAFDSVHGPLTYATDRFYARYYGEEDWQVNVRAIALSLEALRKVDRYGVTGRGEQYAGFKQLPAGRAVPSSMTTEQAYDVLCEILGPECVVDDDVSDAVLIRRARAAAHPDRRGGDRTLWDQVEQAAVVLGVRS